MITDHLWRRFSESSRPHDVDSDACAFMNWRRPPIEHERAASRGDLLVAKAARS